MGSTPNYGWAYPDPTDLVKDLPADFELFADAVDADLEGLLGGTTGQVLTKNSATDHDFDWAAASGLIEIASGTFSGSSVSLTSIPTTYKHLMLTTDGITCSGTNRAIDMQFNGVTTNSYIERGSGISENDTAFSTDRFQFAYYGQSNVGQSTTFIYNYASTAAWKLAMSYWVANDSVNVANADADDPSGLFNGTSAITSIQMLPSSGTFSGGTYKLYGWN